MKILISSSSSEPIYRQITNQIKNSILNGDLLPNELLPSIRKLASELKVSIITTKRAYEELENDGLIETIKGKGCYVSTFNKEDLYKSKLDTIKKHLSSAIEESKSLNLSIEEIKMLLEELYSKS